MFSNYSWVLKLLSALIFKSGLEDDLPGCDFEISYQLHVAFEVFTPLAIHLFEPPEASLIFSRGMKISEELANLDLKTTPQARWKIYIYKFDQTP